MTFGRREHDKEIIAANGIYFCVLQKGGHFCCTYFSNEKFQNLTCIHSLKSSQRVENLAVKFRVTYKLLILLNV
jgi:hypothetical protein